MNTPIVDVLVVGGGIVGAGVARDAAMRGLKVHLVEQNDFASGTSGRSSRLLHGGLRYLAQGRIGLVREASVEKMRLSVIAPHLVQPLPFIFPSYRGEGWPMWKLAVGVKTYDLLCGGKNLGKSKVLTRQALQDRLPELRTERLVGAVRYFDGFTQDARLVLDTLRSASANGAQLTNYTTLVGALFENDLWRAELRSEHGVTEHISARVIVNAAGPWADKLAPSAVRLRLTKGAHLVVDAERLPVTEAVVMVDGPRILFAIPWGNRVILGTTDTDEDGPLDRIRCEPKDRDIILEVVNRSFPDVKLTAHDVISSWAGVRPLITSGRRSEAGNPSEISRSHQIRMPQPGWIDVAGGKLTTYRRMGEQVVDRAAAYLQKEGHLKKPLPQSPTREEPLLNSVPGPSEASGIVPPEPSSELVTHYCHQEWAAHLSDIMIRRTSWAYYRKDALPLSKEVARWMAADLQWDQAKISRECSDFEQIIDSNMCKSS